MRGMVPLLCVLAIFAFPAAAGPYSPPPVGPPPTPPTDAVTTWHLEGHPEIDAMRDTIAGVLRVNEIEFEMGGHPVQGFMPASVYPRIFVRDQSTLTVGAGYFYPADRLRLAVEAFLRAQYGPDTASSEDGWRAGAGAISATVGPDGIIDKATTVSDEETHLVHAAYAVYEMGGGPEWLVSEIEGRSVIGRLNDAGRWLLANRRDGSGFLIKREHTTDWGDVRFQPTGGNPTDIDPADVVWTASLYDQALAYRAWLELAAMNRAVGDEETAASWEGEASGLLDAANRRLWMEERGYFRTHAHLSPLEHDFDEDAIVSIANAVAVRCGLADEAQTRRAIAALERARVDAGSLKPGVVLFPAYPADFFAYPPMRHPGAYQNGGQWDWWGAWQVLAAFEEGYSPVGASLLLAVAADWAEHPGVVYEWQDVNTAQGHGAEDYAGAAGMYAQAVIEGLYGVRLRRDSVSLSPRLGNRPGDVAAYLPGSALYAKYAYRPSSGGLGLSYETNYVVQGVPLEMLLPAGFVPEGAYLDGRRLERWQVEGRGSDRYLSVSLPPGAHALAVYGRPGVFDE